MEAGGRIKGRGLEVGWGQEGHGAESLKGDVQGTVKGIEKQERAVRGEERDIWGSARRAWSRMGTGE